jgi:hypothetical protein
MDIFRDHIKATGNTLKRETPSFQEPPDLDTILKRGKGKNILTIDFLENPGGSM